MFRVLSLLLFLFSFIFFITITPPPRLYLFSYFILVVSHSFISLFSLLFFLSLSLFLSLATNYLIHASDYIIISFESSFSFSSFFLKQKSLFKNFTLFSYRKIILANKNNNQNPTDSSSLAHNRLKCSFSVAICNFSVRFKAKKILKRFFFLSFLLLRIVVKCEIQFAM